MTELSEHDKAVLNCVLYPNLPFTETISTLAEDIEETTPEVEKTQNMEIEAVKVAESGNFEEALEILNRAAKITPNRASIYNNRAHVYQFLKKTNEAFEDLSKAIDLAQDTQKKTLSQALCQRGILHKKASKIDLARDDFERAAGLGNPFAKSQLVELNPYAALCNQMLRQVMSTI